MHELAPTDAVFVREDANTWRAVSYTHLTLPTKA